MASGAGRVNDVLIVLLPAGIDLLDVLRHIFFGVFFQRFSCSHSRSIMINYSLQNLFCVFEPSQSCATWVCTRVWTAYSSKPKKVAMVSSAVWIHLIFCLLPSGPPVIKDGNWNPHLLMNFPLKYLLIGDFPVCHVWLPNSWLVRSHEYQYLIKSQFVDDFHVRILPFFSGSVFRSPKVLGHALRSQPFSTSFWTHRIYIYNIYIYNNVYIYMYIYVYYKNTYIYIMYVQKTW